VSAGRQPKFRDGGFHSLGLDFPKRAIRTKFPAGHLSVGEGSGR
jgi:hypothetical protein